jgi:hypothetical protein
MSKIRKPKKGQPTPAAPQVEPLENTADALVAEWRALNGKIAEFNQLIKEQQEIIDNAQKEANEAQAVIQNLNNAGLQVIGQVGSLSRILAGMGVDPNKHGLSEVEDASENPADVVDISPEVAEEKEVTPSPSAAALRKRFRR